MDFLELAYFGNTVQDYATAVGVAVVIVLSVHLATTVLRRRVSRIAERTTTGVDDLIVDVLAATRLILAGLVALWVGSLFLALPARIDRLLEKIAIAAFCVQFGIWASAAIRGIAERMRQRKLAAGELASISVIGMMGLLARVAAWAIVLMLILDNLGVNITALVAGLGIGGIAIALAAQNILGDLFASISIIFDKPFTIGDFIQVGDQSGTVDQIGLKTTRLRSLGGEELIMPNGDLLASRVRNFKRMKERRVAATFGFSHDTPVDDLRALPGLMRGVVESESDVRFDTATFKAIGESALVFELVYFMTTPDATVFAATQERINLKLLEAFAGRKLKHAYPGRSVYLHAGEAAAPRAS